MQRIKILTAETKQGRLAIEEVMRHSYTADIDSVPAQWALVRVVDDVPVSFILVDPHRQMEFPGGDIRYAFIWGVATREDRRREGHFRGIIEDTFSRLREAGIPLVLTHGHYKLYRRFGFEVFTYHSGIFATPEVVEGKLGMQVSEKVEEFLVIEDSKHLQEDLLLITDVKARSFSECRAALQAAAVLARERGKGRILFEHPAAPSYGSKYPIYPSPETPFTVLARGCGAKICTQGADPEGGSVPDADWIKILDATMFLEEVLKFLEPKHPLPKGIVCFDTDAGFVAIESLGQNVKVSDEFRPDADIVKWPTSSLAQLVTGYQTVEVLSIIHGTALSSGIMALLGVLFPQQWRFSRNESWIFNS